MSVAPILTFKAGQCEIDTSTSPPKVKPLPTPGYLYLYIEDELLHLCWRPRTAPLDNPKIDLLMLPTDGSFSPYRPTSAESPSNSNKPTNGRIYVLKFSSSSQRYLFWLQSRSQHPSGDPSWFSARDLKLGQIVNNLLQGEEVDVEQQMASLPSDQNDPDDQDEDEAMEDVEGTNHDASRHPSQGGGGAGPDATGGDVREEGEQSREGGADGGRAAAAEGLDASALVRNFLQSMEQRNPGSQSTPQDKSFTTLADLLTPATTIPVIDLADGEWVDQLFECLPKSLEAMAQRSAGGSASTANLTAVKKDILKRVLRSPQFSQSLSSLTVALREGGLPTISDALQIPVRHGGYLRHGGVPMGGGEAVEVFLEGVRDKVTKGTIEDDDEDEQMGMN